VLVPSMFSVLYYLYLHKGPVFFHVGPKGKNCLDDE
jgi:hypothetical protein